MPAKALLQCLQVNLRHSSLASSSLAQVILDFNIDIVLVQETYAYPCTPPVVANVPPGFSSYHQLSTDHAYGAVILIRDSVVKAGNIVCKHISNFAACVELSTRHGPLRFSSIYLRPSISNFLTTISHIFEVASAPFAIIGADVIARSRLWNSVYNDKRGSDFESFLVCSRLNIINRPNTELVFVPAGTSFVDLTLAGDQVSVHC